MLETERRAALQYLIDRLNRNGVNVPSIHYMRHNFERDWPGVSEWVEEITPAYNRLVNAIRATIDPQAIVFGGQIPPDLARMMIERTQIFDRPRYDRHAHRCICRDCYSSLSVAPPAEHAAREIFFVR